LGSGERGRNVE